MLEVTTIPGTNIPVSPENVQAFAQIRPILAATEGMTLSQICAMTSMEISTVQNWLKRGLLGNVKGKKYTETQVATIFIINALKSCMKLDDIRDLLTFVSGVSAAAVPNDVVSESELFGYLCNAVLLAQSNPDLVDSSLDTALANFDGSANAKNRLKKTLTVMVYAHLSNQCSNAANLLLKQLI
jgi:DNA-binding transcriptional MerR regulator